MKLLLVDGSAVLHRAYHAYPPLTTKTGEIVGAVYGVASILINALNEIDPTHVAVAWDLPKPTFRHIKYVGYKAQRPKADEEMVKQIPMVKRVIDKMGLLQSEIEGYEADDIIGTLAMRASQNKQAPNFNNQTLLRSDELRKGAANPNDINSNDQNQVIILTGDQDTMQLVNKKVKVMTPPKPIRQAQGKVQVTLYGVEEVIAKYGVRPDQIVDYKALVGDPSDNIPGVAGIGPVTAAKLLNEYGNLEAIYAALNLKTQISNFKLGEQLAEKLIKNQESAFLSQELARIVLNVPITISEEQMQYRGLQGETLKAELEELGFKSLVRRVWPEENKVKEPDKQMGLF